MAVSENKKVANKKDFMEAVYSKLNGDQKVEIAEVFLSQDIISVFKDEELRQSIDAFFANNLNISETSRNAFMHRNTLLYRMDKIHKITGLNIREFKDAVTLLQLEALYDKTKNLR